MINLVEKKNEIDFILLGFIAFLFNIAIILIESDLAILGYSSAGYIHKVGILVSCCLILDCFICKNSIVRHILRCIAISFLFPFTTSVLLLLNQGAIACQFLFMLVVVLLTSFLNNKILPPSIVVSSFFAYIWSMEFYGIDDASSSVVFTIFCALLFLLFFNSHNLSTGNLYEEKLEILKTISGSIAHELRTPMTAVIAGIKSMEVHYSDILLGYKMAIEAGLPVNMVSPQYLVNFDSLVSRTQKHAEEAQYTMEMLMMKSGVWSRKGNMNVGVCDASSLIGLVLGQYPFDEEFRDLVSVDVDENFKFKGDMKLMSHVLSNLLKNAFYSIKKANKGCIYIKLRSHRIIIRDTGSGIREDDIPYIFDVFFTKSRSGTGVGLAFCKLAVEALGGSLFCSSVEGEYAEFTIVFSPVNELIDKKGE